VPPSGRPPGAIPKGVAGTERMAPMPLSASTGGVGRLDSEVRGATNPEVALCPMMFVEPGIPLEAPTFGFVATRRSLKPIESGNCGHSDDLIPFSTARPITILRGGVCDRGARSNAADAVDSCNRVLKCVSEKKAKTTNLRE
jgi:hypothetical protein